MQTLSLEILQQRFLSVLRSNRYDVDARWLCAAEGPPITFGKRLEIYHSGVNFRFETTLAEDFPRLRKMLGKEDFRNLVSAYLNAFPPRSPGLAELGKDLPGFLASPAAAAWSGRPWLSEVARLEWNCILSLWAPEIPLIDMSSLAETDPNQIRLELRPSVFLMETAWQIDLPVITASEPVYLVIYRRSEDVVFERATPEQWQLLRALQEGVVISELETTLSRLSLSKTEAIPLIQSWTQKEILGAHPLFGRKGSGCEE